MYNYDIDVFEIFLFLFTKLSKLLIAELSIRKLGSSSVLIICSYEIMNRLLLALMKIRAYGSKALQ